MSRKSKYYKVQDGLDLAVEKEFLGVKNIKAYIILKELSTTDGSLDNKTIAKNCGMSLASYKEWKNHLVFCGLLQVRQLNASTYIYCLGEYAIAQDDIMHDDKDYKKLIEECFGDSYLIDEPNNDDKAQECEVQVKMPKVEFDTSVYDKNPMPTTEDIIKSF